MRGYKIRYLVAAFVILAILAFTMISSSLKTKEYTDGFLVDAYDTVNAYNERNVNEAVNAYNERNVNEAVNAYNERNVNEAVNAYNERNVSEAVNAYNERNVNEAVNAYNERNVSRAVNAFLTDESQYIIYGVPAL